MNNKLYEKRNAEVLTETDIARLNSEYQTCSSCREELPKIKFYPQKEDDRSGLRCNECIICTETRLSNNIALRVKHFGIPVRQAKKHERHAELLSQADVADIFRLTTFTEVCDTCHVKKAWTNFYPVKWDIVAGERVTTCIDCDDVKKPVKKEIVQSPENSI